MHLYRECGGTRPGGLEGCERSRMGDAFQPPSPAPFVIVTEAAVNRERERDLARQNIGKALGSAKSSMTAVQTARSLLDYSAKHWAAHVRELPVRM